MIKSSKSLPTNSSLPPKNAQTQGIDEAWVGTNEQWWNWYISLADNSQAPVNQENLLSQSEFVLENIPSLDQLKKELNEPYHVSDAQIEKFQTESYLRLKKILTPGSLYLLRQELKHIFNQHYDFDPSRKFSSREMIWIESDIAKEFVLSKRLGQLAAQLLEVSSVRVYHDDFLCKEPGCGRTPWHYDAHHYPISSKNVGTMWIPLQPTPKEMGPLQFAKEIETYKLLQEIPFDKFSVGYDRAISEAFETHGVVVDCEPFELGEISFQHCLNVHSAGANYTNQQRIAFGISYFEDGSCVIDTPTLISGDWQKFMQGVKPSQPIASIYNPIVYDSKN